MDIQENTGLDYQSLLGKGARGVERRSDVGGGGGEGVLPERFGGVCGPLPKTLTLFMTKICDFPFPICDQTKNSIP